MITVFNGLATGCPCHLYEVAKVVMAIADVEDFTLQTKRLMLIVFREQDEGGQVPVHSAIHCRRRQGIHPCGEAVNQHRGHIASLEFDFVIVFPALRRSLEANGLGPNYQLPALPHRSRHPPGIPLLYGQRRPARVHPAEFLHRRPVWVGVAVVVG
ncbi:hypothetical protein thsps21_29130 [Pseudomonas sp. No.21]|nr:hypothetical protein TUM20249_13820 [Pseudomonas tohonis]